MASNIGRPQKAPDPQANRDLGPDNIYADFGCPDADERLLKATLVTRIRAVIADRELTQARAGQIMGIPQPKVSELVRGSATGFSAERLIRFLNTLGVSVSIALRAEPDWEPGTTFVHFDREPDSDMIARTRKSNKTRNRLQPWHCGNMMSVRPPE
jgi:predicted XRE-type DNA-binding protein